jgi:hypothetical protein
MCSVLLVVIDFSINPTISIDFEAPDSPFFTERQYILLPKDCRTVSREQKETNFTLATSVSPPSRKILLHNKVHKEILRD